VSVSFLAIIRYPAFYYTQYDVLPVGIFSVIFVRLYQFDPNILFDIIALGDVFYGAVDSDFYTLIVFLQESEVFFSYFVYP